MYQEIVAMIQQFDNGYTDSDYKKAQGEACLHPRVYYDTDDIKIEINSDPHRLFCYIVTIENKNTGKSNKVYVNSEDYEEIRKKIEKYDFVMSYA